jgi:hypothetical protein
MTEQELENVLDEMYARFGELPSPEHEPKRFKYYVKLYKFYKNQK